MTGLLSELDTGGFVSLESEVEKPVEDLECEVGRAAGQDGVRFEPGRPGGSQHDRHFPIGAPSLSTC